MARLSVAVIKSTLIGCGMAAYSLVPAVAQPQILVASCSTPDASSAIYCNDGSIMNFWTRPGFMSALGTLISDSDGSLEDLRLIGRVIDLDGELFLEADGADSGDMVSVFLNGIDLAAVSASGVQNLQVQDLNSASVTVLETTTVSTSSSTEPEEAAVVFEDESSSVELSETTELTVTGLVVEEIQQEVVQADDERYQMVSRLTAETIDQLSTCRQVASRALDGGQEIADMDGEAAVAACEPVARVLINEPEVQFLYARALDANGLQGAAIDVYESASGLGSGKADASLGRLYLETDLDARQTLAAGALQRGVEREDPVAAYRLYDLKAGSDNEEDAAKTKAHLKLSTLSGYVPAILESARLAVAEPDQTELSDEELESLLLSAADNGDAQSKSYLGRQWIVNDDPRRKDAVVFLRDASGAGDKPAASTLGLLLLSGDVEPQEGDDARQLLEISVDEGNATVKSALAALILTQDGLDADKERVVSLLSSAAAEGDAGSATNLGTFYRTGLFVEQSMDTAARWYLIGLSLGSEDFSEQIFGYAPWDERGSAGLTQSIKGYLNGLGLLVGEINDERDSQLAKAVTRYLLEVDAMAEGRVLIEDDS